MVERPRSTTILSVTLAAYGALTLLALPLGFAAAGAESGPVGLSMALALLVGALSIVSGATLWRLSRHAPIAFMALALALLVFNLDLLRGFTGVARTGAYIGLLGTTVLAVLLYRHITKVCASAA